MRHFSQVIYCPSSLRLKDKLYYIIMEKKFYDDGAFYVEHKSWGTWQSHYPDGKGLITSLTEEECIRASRWYLQAKQEGEFDKSPEKTYSTKDNYKL